VVVKEVATFLLSLTGGDMRSLLVGTSFCMTKPDINWKISEFIIVFCDKVYLDLMRFSRGWDMVRIDTQPSSLQVR